MQSIYARRLKSRRQTCRPQTARCSPGLRPSRATQSSRGTPADAGGGDDGNASLREDKSHEREVLTTVSRIHLMSGSMRQQTLQQCPMCHAIQIFLSPCAAAMRQICDFNMGAMPDHPLCVHSTGPKGKRSWHALLGPSWCYYYVKQHHGTHAFTIPSLFSHTSIASHSPRFMYGIHSSGFTSNPCAIGRQSESCIASAICASAGWGWSHAKVAYTHTPDMASLNTPVASLAAGFTENYPCSPSHTCTVHCQYIA